ncbi:MAG: carbamoyltransferase C-terminal domain-containing protein [Gammaproteobacteria bacterium]
MTPGNPNPLVLGICDSHDAGVAVVRGNEVLAAINEERLTRRKMAAGIPYAALEAIWALAGVSPTDVDVVALAGLSAAGARIPLNNDFCADDGSALPQKSLAEALDRVPGGGYLMSRFAAHPGYQAMLERRARQRVEELGRLLADLEVHAPIKTYEHHDCHAASAYWAGGHADALVVTNDGFGDALCSKVQTWSDERRGLHTLHATSFYDSLGVYYNFATLLCGFRKAHHAGKTTGLAAYGDPSGTRAVFADLLQWDERRGQYRNRGGVFANCLRTLRERLAGFSREDIAAGVQAHLEEVLCSMVAHFLARTGRRHLVLAGGVHANVKANQRIAALPGIDEMFVFPGMGDGGLAVGAAYLAAQACAGSVLPPRRLPDVYLGTAYDEQQMADALAAASCVAERPADMARAVAAELAANRIVARCSGRMEFGPRALGNRSILYPADRAEVNGWLNKQLHRTEFMPFAPVMRTEDAANLLVGYDDRTAYTAQFMTVTYDVTRRCREEAPAVVHIDGTARPQVIERSVNPEYHDILTAYHALSGLSVLVNTSFNMHEEPIVCTPEDAIKAFFDSGLDVLALGPFLLRNPRAERGS